MLLFENDEKRVEPIDLVTITKEEYADLLSAAEKWELFRISFYDNAFVAEDIDLAIAGYKVCGAMRVLDGQKYKEALDAGINQNRK